MLSLATRSSPFSLAGAELLTSSTVDSCVYFIRPYFDAILTPLSDLSPKIAAAAAESPVLSKMEKGVTAGDWFKRRVTNQRAANRKGPESWAASRGTERAFQISRSDARALTLLVW
jgi:hypothetical protein